MNKIMILNNDVKGEDMIFKRTFRLNRGYEVRLPVLYRFTGPAFQSIHLKPGMGSLKLRRAW